MDDLTGKQFGPYKIVGPLGQGGMATVYRAHQTGMDRQVALKALPKAAAGQLAGRFQQEAKVLAQLQHPHVLPIFDFGEAGAYLYIVMPFIKNGTLADQLKGKPLPLPEITRIITQVADALDYAHTRGIVHRDVKPSNILMDERNNCLLSDFGIAKWHAESAQFTTTQSTVGTPRYMSPEQGLGEKLDRRSDVYSLGVILYEMVTGRVPFDAETPMALVVKHINAALPPPRQTFPDLPVAVEAVILKALAKNPKDRFATAKDLAVALQAAVPGGAAVALGNEAPVSEFAPTLPLFPFVRRGQRPAALLWAAGALIVMGVFAVGWWWAQSGPAFPLGLAPTLGVSPTAGATAALPTIAPTSAANFTATFTAPTPATPAPTTPVGVTSTEPPLPTSTPTLGLGSAITSSVDGMVQVYVPAGKFLMGSIVAQDKNAINNEKPQHEVTLNAFWIDEKEITNAQYATCVQAEACPPPRQFNSATRNPYYGVEAFAQHPVVYVQWYDARTYCNWVERRLPTEAEWEKAARGAEGQIYPWGDTFPDGSFLNFDSRVVGDTSAVGSYVFGVSPYGALDMAGNVWEWVADTYRQDYYENSPSKNPTGPETGSLKIYRGGAWNEPLWNVRAAIRMPGKPGDAFPNVGFRCAMDAP